MDDIERIYKLIDDNFKALNSKIDRLFQKSDNHIEKIVEHSVRINNIEKRKDKFEDRGWKFIINVTSRLAIAIAVIIIGFLKFGG